MYKIRWAILRKGIQTVLVPYHHTQRCFAMYDKSKGLLAGLTSGGRSQKSVGSLLAAARISPPKLFLRMRLR